MTTLNRYIDRCLIDEHAIKDYLDGYSLDVASLPKHERLTFLQTLFEHDDVLQEMVLDRMQELINQRLPWVESQAKYNSGLRPKHDPINGEVKWIFRGAV